MVTGIAYYKYYEEDQKISVQKEMDHRMKLIVILVILGMIPSFLRALTAVHE